MNTETLAPVSAPYLSLSDALRSRYGARTYRLTLTGGKTCPTRDGTFGPKKGWGGCTFCDQYGSASFYAQARKAADTLEQLEAAARGIRRRYKAEKFIAYFQSYTTTHQEITEFRERYAVAVNFPDVVALAVATRPDCLPDEFLALLGEQLAKVDVILELGVQSFHDATLDWYDRGHDAECAREGIHRAKNFARQAMEKYPHRRFDVVAHMILGSPTESMEDVVRGAHELNALGVDGVKIHHLHVLTKTKLAATYKRAPFTLHKLEDYNEIVATFLRHLDPAIVVHRTHATAPRKEEIIGPDWTHMPVYPNGQLRELLAARGWRQGDLL